MTFSSLARAIGLLSVALLCTGEHKETSQECPEQTFTGLVLNVTYLESSGDIKWPVGVDPVKKPAIATGPMVDMYDMIKDR